MKKLISNLSYSFAANMASLLVSVLTVLLVPALWGETSYGWYQLYLFYISYVGFFHLGWADGIYLRVGGMSYQELDKKLYASQFFLLAGLSAALAAVIAAGCAVVILSDPDRRFVLQMFAVCILLYLPVTYLTYLFQATGRIRAYAKVLLAEKLVFSALLFLLALRADAADFHGLVLADLAGKAVSLAIGIWYARDLLASGFCRLKTALHEMRTNISVGCKLMAANVAGMLMIGIVRFAIEQKWGVTVFGKVSLALSISNLFITFVTAVSIVIFPALKQTDAKRQTEIYQRLRSLLMPALFLAMLFYCPAQSVLGALLPAYRESLRYLALMLPVCVFECKLALLVNTYLKVLRMEKQILFVNLAVVAMSFCMTGLTVYAFRSLNAAVAGIVLLAAARVYMGEAALARVMRFDFLRPMLWELALTAAFILTGWLIGGWRSMLLYALALAVYSFHMRGELRQSGAFFRSGI